MAKIEKRMQERWYHSNKLMITKVDGDHWTVDDYYRLDLNGLRAMMDTLDHIIDEVEQAQESANSVATREIG